MALPQHLRDFFATRPALKVIKREDEPFNATKRVFVETADVPLVIVRPQNAEDVAALVGHLSANSVPLTVRVGGHDLSTRSVAQDAVQIDLRDLDSVRVAADRKTAQIGGGILSQGLLDALAAEGLMTAVGNSGDVGWCSWAMNGGYGIVASKYGLGCDQILGATLVLADGRIVKADDRLLKALRGAGPAFGIIVELEIKVYPHTDIVGGVILCDNTPDITHALTTYFDNCRSLMDSVRTLPAELYFQPMISTAPGTTSPGWVVQFIWAGTESDDSNKWLQKVLSVCPGGKAAVGQASPAEYLRQFTKGGPKGLQGGASLCASIQSMVPSQEAAAVIAKHAALVKPNYGAMFIHMIHGQSMTAENGAHHPDSVFLNREPHLMAEILGFAFADGKDNSAAAEWCRNAHDAFNGVEGVMSEKYFPLVQSKLLRLENVFGKELEFLQGVKKEVDPGNVFFNPMPLAI